MQRTTPPRYRPPLKRPEPVESSLGSFVGRCPHLGTRADAGTALAFASDAHQCYSTRLPVPVSTVHQQSYCLSGAYAECPVFQQSVRAGTAAPLVTAPPSWGVPEEETVTNVVIAPARSRSGGRGLIVPLVLLLALLAGGWWLWRGILSQSDTVQQPSTNNLAIGAATATAADVATGSVSGDTGQAIVITNPTATPAPAQATDEAPRPPSDSGISLPVLPTASVASGVAAAAECIVPDWWVPYIVQANDSLLALAQLRGLLAEDVMVANCLTTGQLETGQILLLPPLATVIGLTPVVPVIVPTRVVDSIAEGGIIIVATQVVATPPTVAALVTPDAGSPDIQPTSPPLPPQPTSLPQATATSIAPTRFAPTATLPSLFPTATPTTTGPTGTPGPTATPPSTVPTATPPFAGPTQTPPPLRP